MPFAPRAVIVPVWTTTVLVLPPPAWTTNSPCRTGPPAPGTRPGPPIGPPIGPPQPWPRPPTRPGGCPGVPTDPDGAGVGATSAAAARARAGVTPPDACADDPASAFAATPPTSRPAAAIMTGRTRDLMTTSSALPCSPGRAGSRGGPERGPHRR